MQKEITATGIIPKQKKASAAIVRGIFSAARTPDLKTLGMTARTTVA
jgi:hypothetical protein